MAIENEMHQHFKELRETAGAELHIGSSMFFCTYVLPSLLSDFQAQYPQVSLTFSEGSSNTLVERLLEGRLDLLLEAEKAGKRQAANHPLGHGGAGAGGSGPFPHQPAAGTVLLHL